MKPEAIKKLRGELRFWKTEAKQWRKLYEKQRGGEAYDLMQAEMAEMRQYLHGCQPGILAAVKVIMDESGWQDEVADLLRDIKESCEWSKKVPPSRQMAYGYWPLETVVKSAVVAVAPNPGPSIKWAPAAQAPVPLRSAKGVGRG